MGLSHNRQDGCIYDPATGVKLNNNLIDYKWFSFNDIKGPFNPNFVENGFGYGPYGYIGCSESLAAVNSTTLNLALYNAIGKWVTDTPYSRQSTQSAGKDIGGYVRCEHSVILKTLTPLPSTKQYQRLDRIMLSYVPVARICSGL
jgi:hypothetical protein